MNWDKFTTFMGLGMSGLVVATIDFQKLAAGDRAEIIRAAFAFLVAAFGVATNKGNKKQ